MSRFITLLSLVAVFALTSCNMISDSTSTTNVSGTVYMWIAPYTDTQISSESPDKNYINQSFLSAGRANIPGTSVNFRTMYIKFLMPILPEGAEIKESYFEGYYAGKNEDGTTDDAVLNFSEVGTKWNAKTVTWNNGPDMKQVINSPSPITIKLNSQDWSGTGDITPLVKRLINDTASNTGFRVTLSDSRKFYKSFYSNNDFRGIKPDQHRSDSTLGLAPRMLIKIVLPAGKTTKDIYYPPLPADHDIKLGTFFKTRGLVWMADYASGTDWPTAWKVKKGL